MNQHAETCEIFNKVLNKDMSELIMNHIYKYNHQKVMTQLNSKYYQNCGECQRIIPPKDKELVWLYNIMGPSYSFLNSDWEWEESIDNLQRQFVCMCKYRCLICVKEENLLANDSFYCQDCNKSMTYYLGFKKISETFKHD